MTSRGRSAVLLTLGLALVLGGCVPAPGAPDPEPTTEPVSTRELEDGMLSILPTVLPDGVTEERSTGLQDETFRAGYGEWSGTEHDDHRLARAQGSYLSEGWNDPTLGPGYWAIVEVAVMESERAADAAMQDIASSAKVDSTVDAVGDSPEIVYGVPAAQIRSEFPTGTVEMELRMLWSTGERTNGWITYSSSGPYVLIVWGVAVPYEGSDEAMDAFFDENLPELVSKFEALAEA